MRISFEVEVELQIEYVGIIQVCRYAWLTVQRVRDGCRACSSFPDDRASRIFMRGSDSP
jgi:hypothetical protein